MENELLRKASRRIALWMNSYTQKEGIELEKMTVGIEVLLINVSKLVIIYSLAALLGTLPITFAAHFSYALLKRYSFGLHALNSTVCTAVSCCLFIFLPLALTSTGVAISSSVLVAVHAVAFIIFYRYAPADTESRPLIGAYLRYELRVRALASVILLQVVALLAPSDSIRLALVLGVVYQIGSIVPITYRVLGRRGRNYERYEPSNVPGSAAFNRN